MIVYGSGNADGNRHTHTNLPMILAGAGGGTLKPGRYVKHGSKPAANLFLTMAQTLGIRTWITLAIPRAGSKTWSVERGAWSVERGAWSVERGA